MVDFTASLNFWNEPESLLMSFIVANSSIISVAVIGWPRLIIPNTNLLASPCEKKLFLRWYRLFLIS